MILGSMYRLHKGHRGLCRARRLAVAKHRNGDIRITCQSSYGVALLVEEVDHWLPAFSSLLQLLCSFVLKAVGVPVCAAKLLSRSPAQAAAVLEARDFPLLSICLNRSSSPSLLSSDLSMGECVSSACQAKDANTFGRRLRDHAFAFNAMSIFASGLPLFSRMYVGPSY
jgi:hypothetical protein